MSIFSSVISGSKAVVGMGTTVVNGVSKVAIGVETVSDAIASESSLLVDMHNESLQARRDKRTKSIANRKAKHALAVAQAELKAAAYIQEAKETLTTGYRELDESAAIYAVEEAVAANKHTAKLAKLKEKLSLLSTPITQEPVVVKEVVTAEEQPVASTVIKGLNNVILP